jgi:hypothetical protein
LIAVVVLAAFTSAWRVAVLVLKLVSPAYVAVTVFDPALVEASEQLPVPDASVTVQLTAPSLTFTVLPGMPAPGATAATVTLTV